MLDQPKMFMDLIAKIQHQPNVDTQESAEDLGQQRKCFSVYSPSLQSFTISDRVWFVHLH